MSFHHKIWNACKKIVYIHHQFYQNSFSIFSIFYLGRSIDDMDHTFAGEPQEEGMMQRSSRFPLITKPRLSDPVGLGEDLARCQRRRLRLLTWTCTQSQTNYFSPNETERLSISPACWTQRIKCVDVKYDESEIWSPSSKWWWKAIKTVVNNVGK